MNDHPRVTTQKLWRTETCARLLMQYLKSDIEEPPAPSEVLTCAEEQQIQQEVITCQAFEDNIDNMVHQGLQQYPHVDPATTHKEIENNNNIGQ